MSSNDATNHRYSLRTTVARSPSVEAKKKKKHTRRNVPVNVVSKMDVDVTSVDAFPAIKTDDIVVVTAAAELPCAISATEEPFETPTTSSVVLESCENCDVEKSMPTPPIFATELTSPCASEIPQSDESITYAYVQSSRSTPLVPQQLLGDVSRDISAHIESSPEQSSSVPEAPFTKSNEQNAYISLHPIQTLPEEFSRFGPHQDVPGFIEIYDTNRMNIVEEPAPTISSPPHHIPSVVIDTSSDPTPSSSLNVAALPKICPPAFNMAGKRPASVSIQGNVVGAEKTYADVGAAAAKNTSSSGLMFNSARLTPTRTAPITPTPLSSRYIDTDSENEDDNDNTDSSIEAESESSSNSSSDCEIVRMQPMKNFLVHNPSYPTPSHPISPSSPASKPIFGKQLLLRDYVSKEFDMSEILKIDVFSPFNSTRGATFTSLQLAAVLCHRWQFPHLVMLTRKYADAISQFRRCRYAITNIVKKIGGVRKVPLYSMKVIELFEAHTHLLTILKGMDSAEPQAPSPLPSQPAHTIPKKRGRPPGCKNIVLKTTTDIETTSRPYEQSSRQYCADLSNRILTRSILPSPTPRIDRPAPSSYSATKRPLTAQIMEASNSSSEIVQNPLPAVFTRSILPSPTPRINRPAPSSYTPQTGSATKRPLTAQIMAASNSSSEIVQNPLPAATLTYLVPSSMPMPIPTSSTPNSVSETSSSSFMKAMTDKLEIKKASLQQMNTELMEECTKLGETIVAMKNVVGVPDIQEYILECSRRHDDNMKRILQNDADCKALEAAASPLRLNPHP